MQTTRRANMRRLLTVCCNVQVTAVARNRQDDDECYEVTEDVLDDMVCMLLYMRFSRMCGQMTCAEPYMQYDGAVYIRMYMLADLVNTRSWPRDPFESLTFQ